MPKISIIGAGNVGGTAALFIAQKSLGDVVLVDIVEGLAKGKALDIFEAMPLEGSDVKVIGGQDYKLTKDSDIVVITAGLPRKPGMSRDDLVEINSEIVREITSKVVKFSPNCILIIVSNPLDAMVYVAHKTSKFPRERIIGMAGVLDSTRFRSFIADELKVSVNSVSAYVLGGHADTMVPMERYAKIKEEPLTKLLPKEKIAELAERTRNGGGEFLPLLQTSAWVAPAAAITEMVESIVKDKKKVLPCAAFLDGEYGVNGLFIGVLVKLGKRGVEEIVEVELNESERKAFKKTVEHVSGVVRGLK